MTSPSDRPVRRTRDAAAAAAPVERPVRPQRAGAAGVSAERPVRPQRAAAGAAAGAAAPARGPRGAARPAPAAPARRPEPLPLPRVRTGFMGNICSVMEDLYEVLNQESAALEARDMTLVTHLQDRKEGLSRLYTECIVNLRRDPELAKGLSDPDREALKAAGDVLRKAVDENMRQLTSGIGAVESVIQSVIDIARELGAKDVQVYQPQGTMADGKGRAALTVNREL